MSSKIVPCFRVQAADYANNFDYPEKLKEEHVDSPFGKKIAHINRNMGELDKKMSEIGYEIQFIHPRFVDQFLGYDDQGMRQCYVGVLRSLNDEWDSKDLEEFLSVFKDKKSLFESGDEKGQTLLFHALQNYYRGKTSTRLKKIQILLKAGADSNIANVQGHTPLYLAAEKGDKEMCEQLFLQNAQIGEKWAENMRNDLEKVYEVQKTATAEKLAEVTGLPPELTEISATYGLIEGADAKGVCLIQ